VPGPDPHELLIEPDSAYSVGTGANTGQRANLRLPWHYPVEAVCVICGYVVRREKLDPACPDWMHLDRLPGDTI
jgi:hypothetical protein